jgi:hypothetical protein
MEEWEIATALRRARPHPLHDSIPAALRPWLLAAEWDQERLWAIDRPVTALPIGALRWCYALPWWRADGDDRAWFRVAPRDVIERPDAYPEHVRRIATADGSRPLHVLHRHSRWMVVDGLHRLVQADLRGEHKVRVVPLGRVQLASILVRAPDSRNDGGESAELSSLASWT